MRFLLFFSLIWHWIYTRVYFFAPVCFETVIIKKFGHQSKKQFRQVSRGFYLTVCYREIRRHCTLLLNCIRTVHIRTEILLYIFNAYVRRIKTGHKPGEIIELFRSFDVEKPTGRLFLYSEQTRMPQFESRLWSLLLPSAVSFFHVCAVVGKPWETYLSLFLILLWNNTKRVRVLSHFEAVEADNKTVSSTKKIL